MRHILLFVPLYALFVYIPYFSPRSSVKSVDDLLDRELSVGLFMNLVAHTEYDYAKPGLTQRDRLVGVKRVMIATIEALRKIGLPAWLDAGSLLGYVRHDQGIIPWDDDADIGFDVAECLKRFPEEHAFESALLSVIDQQQFAISRLYPTRCISERRADGMRHVTGRIVDKATGAFTDLFAYRELSLSNANTSDINKQPWTRFRDPSIPRMEELFDFPPYYTKTDNLYPLQKAKIFDVDTFLPAKPIPYLNNQYGKILTPVIYPWGLVFNAHTSLISYALGIFSILITMDRKVADSAIIGLGLIWWNIGGVVEVVSILGLLMYSLIVSSIQNCLNRSRNHSVTYLDAAFARIKRKDSDSSIQKKIHSVFESVRRLGGLLWFMFLGSLLFDSWPIVYQVYEQLLEISGHQYYQIDPPRHIHFCLNFLIGEFCRTVWV